jgi:hypothetical protein
VWNFTPKEKKLMSTGHPVIFRPMVWE